MSRRPHGYLPIRHSPATVEGNSSGALSRHGCEMAAKRTGQPKYNAARIATERERFPMLKLRQPSDEFAYRLGMIIGRLIVAAVILLFIVFLL